MDHSYLEKIYNDIREEPYLVSTKLGVEAPNCYFKGLRLLKSAAELGYEVRARVGDIDWSNTPTPQAIVSLIPSDHQETHFYTEIFLNNEWRILDPSIDSKTEKLGFRSVYFTGDKRTCFDLKKIYSQEEQIATFKNLNNQNLRDYFQKMGPFLTAFNKWIEAERAKI